MRIHSNNPLFQAILAVSAAAGLSMATAVAHASDASDALDVTINVVGATADVSSEVVHEVEVPDVEDHALEQEDHSEAADEGSREASHEASEAEDLASEAQHQAAEAEEQATEAQQQTSEAEQQSVESQTEVNTETP